MSNKIDFVELMSNNYSKMGVVGSRNWPDKNFVLKTVSEYLNKHKTIETLVSGGQPRGVDSWVENIALEKGLKFKEYLPAHKYPTDDPRYKEFHVSNYHIRNQQIVNESDILLAFCYHNSNGTQSTYKKAIRSDKCKPFMFTENDL